MSIPIVIKDQRAGYAPDTFDFNQTLIARKEPQSQLTFTPFAGNQIIKSVGVDGKVYAIANESSNLVQSSVDGGANWVNGVQFSAAPISISDNVRYITKINERYIAYLTNTGGTNGSVWISDAFATGWRRVLTTLPFQNISISPPQIDAVTGQTVLLLGEYGTTAVTRKLWMSRDGGLNWKAIYTAVPGDGSTNCHIHHACYDPLTGRIYIAVGDGLNAFFGYSPDYGNTWGPIEANGAGPDNQAVSLFNQPTIVYPLTEYIATTPDGSQEYTGVWAVDRDTGKVTVAHEVIPVQPYKSFPIYPHTTGGSRDKLYILYYPATGFTTDIYIIGTADGGKSWHRIFTRTYVAGTVYFPIVGTDALGNIYFTSKLAGTVTIESAPDIIWMVKS